MIQCFFKFIEGFLVVGDDQEVIQFSGFFLFLLYELIKRDLFECVEEIVGKGAVIDRFQTAIEEVQVKRDYEIGDHGGVEGREPNGERDKKP